MSASRYRRAEAAIAWGFRALALVILCALLGWPGVLVWAVIATVGLTQ